MILASAGRRGLLAATLLLLPALGRAARAEPPSSASWGTPHPLILQAISPRGEWVVACQARRDTDGDGAVKVWAGHHGGPSGDDVETYLLQGPGEGRLITEFVAASPSGDHVAFLVDGSLRLLSVRDRREVDLSALGADARDHGVPFWRHRAAKFDADGRSMLWFRGGAPEVAGLMLRDLAAGTDRRIDVGRGLAMDASFLEGGGWIHVLMAREWTPEPTGPAFPEYVTTLDPRRCRAQSRSYSVMAGPRTPLEDGAVSRIGTALRRAHILAQMGPDLLVRQDDGELVRWEPAGAEHVLVKAEHAPWVDSVSTREGTALVCHTAGPDRGRWFLMSAGGAAPVALTATREASGPTQKQDSPRQPEDRWTRVRDGDHSRRVDLRTGAVSDFPQDLWPGSSWPGKPWRQRRVRTKGAESFLCDFATQRERPLELDVSLEQVWDFQVRESGAKRAMGGVVIDLEGQRVVGRYAGEALSVAPDGRVLVAAGPGEDGVHPGPLRWIVPWPSPSR